MGRASAPRPASILFDIGDVIARSEPPVFSMNVWADSVEPQELLNPVWSIARRVEHAVLGSFAARFIRKPVPTFRNPLYGRCFA